MTSVLITRPRAAAEILATKLMALGYQPVIEPLLDIVPTHTACPPLDNIEAVIITSGNVALAFDAQRVALAPLLELPCFCIGPQTAEKMRGYGFRWVQNGESDGAALSAFVGRALSQNTSLLHIGGEEMNGDTGRELEALGHPVSIWPVYRAVPVAAFSPYAVNLLKTGKLDATVLFSPRTAETLAHLLTHAALEACCAGLTAICLSEAVAKALKHLSWRRLATASVPTEDAVISCLQKNCPVTS